MSIKRGKKRIFERTDMISMLELNQWVIFINKDC